MSLKAVLLLPMVVFVLCAAAQVSVKPQRQQHNCTQCSLPRGPPGSDGADGIPGVPGIPGTPGNSLTYSEIQQLKDSIKQDLQLFMEREILHKTKIKIEEMSAPKACNLGLTKHDPAKSCYQIYQCNPSATSKTYWLETKDNGLTTIREVYCDMEIPHCGSKGWTRIGYINMTEPGASCPSSLGEISSPKKACIRADGSRGSCSSVNLPAHGLKYNKVCGQAVAYAKGSPDSFHGPKDLNSYYVDGISITYGSPKKHIWTYAAGLSDDYNYILDNCPCAKYPGRAPPSFVGDHYYCESGSFWKVDIATVYINDPLWDGAGCGAGNNCCSQPGMPWFCRTLPQEVEEDIELRICANSPFSDEEIYLELLEIYIQ